MNIVRAVLPHADAPAPAAQAATALIAPIDTYFDDVMVMDENPSVRANRLGFLAAIRDLVAPVLDWREVA